MTDRDPASIEERVVEIVAEVLGLATAEVGPETVLAAHAWDSIASLEALAQLEARLRVTLDLRVFHGVRTVGDLVAAVAADDAGRAAAAP
ncbi:acyl carrier protein [Actinomadura algeriensis]|uniref:Acyl carrier protein n=1 Tax=Actinomadura algeriensis TaxID=1679523 RepID=A0ABR9JTL4_9ACTN|nr:acyl carrier protein [Actinomadura algeriensis]MBE1533914.1 acyl carrier protein [Actinomadura algeriensis]